MKKEELQGLFSQHGWDDVILEDHYLIWGFFGEYVIFTPQHRIWGFSKGAVMPTPVPLPVVNKVLKLALAVDAKYKQRRQFRFVLRILFAPVTVLSLLVFLVATIYCLAPTQTIAFSRIFGQVLLKICFLVLLLLCGTLLVD
jgi:hypothetical protein